LPGQPNGSHQVIRAERLRRHLAKHAFLADPGPHPDVLTYQGFANRKLSNYDVAISYYSAALKLDPEHRGANEYLGEYYVETGQLAKANAQLVKLDRICKFGCEEAEELRRWIDGARS
jgi:tetratricopeptide (TPR) repeat protein